MNVWLINLLMPLDLINGNMECSIVKALNPVIDLKVGVSLYHGTSLRHFTSSSLSTFPIKG